MSQATGTAGDDEGRRTASGAPPGYEHLDPATRAFYCRTMSALNDEGVPYMVGGAYSFARYTGIERHTKDFDIFIRREDYERVMRTLARSGCQTEFTFPHWLGKAHCGGADFIDVIFSSGNAVARVDEEWFENAVEGEVLGVPVLLCPAEETIWSKAFVMERERYDGADIAHLLRACGSELDWARLLRRFGPYWRVLLSHLLLFGFIYPSHRDRIPEWVMSELIRRVQDEMRTPPPQERICQGTLISRAQYLVDVEQWGYRDARVDPAGHMTASEVAHWTRAIEPGH